MPDAAKQNPEKTRKNKDNRANENRTEVHAEEFIPYACHYDPYTILTKNGELMQVIKVTGFTFESVHKSDTEILTLRSAIRRAVRDSIKTNNFSLWFHTIRRKKDISTGGEYEPGFADSLNRAWCERNDWEHKYVNELYISILIEGQPLSLKDLKTFFRSIYYPLELRFRSVYLQKAARDLNRVTDAMLNVLNGYGARKLGFIKKGGVYYSELAGFLGKIINLKEAPAPVRPVDISEQLPSHAVSFGFNVVEVSGETGRHFGAILAVKEYHEVSTTYIDEFLQLPVQFIITETFDFVNQKSALEKFENIYKLQMLSEDHAITAASGIGEIMKSDTSSPVDFGEHQITIMVLEDTMPALENEITQLVRALRDLGVVAVREDILMEDCYWAQLPGNFEFIKRLTPINARKIGGYASLYGFPAGRLDGNHWGPAVTVFHTAVGTPYFFNFHYEDNGHALIVGPYGSGKTVLMNFLLSEAQKFAPALYFFDHSYHSEIFIRALGGKYHRMLQASGEGALKLNPFSLPDTPENRQFLAEWLSLLLTEKLASLSNATQENIKNAVDFAYSLAPQERKLGNIIPRFWSAPDARKEEDSAPPPDDIEALLSGSISGPGEAGSQARSYGSAEERLAEWHGEGEFSSLFDHVDDEFSGPEKGSRICGFDMTQIVRDGIAMLPLLTYLLRRIYDSLDGRPSILVLDEAWALIDNEVIAPRMEEWLDKFRSKNAVIILATESLETAESSSVTPALAHKIETKIFLPNPKASDAYTKIFGLTEREFDLLKVMEASRHEFLLKHNVDAVIAKLSLKGMDHELAVLSARPETVALMEGAIKDAGELPQQWMPLFKERLSL